MEEKERELKMRGEEIAEIAVNFGMGAKQLQTIYRLVKTRPLPFVEAFIERQIGRGLRGLPAFMKIHELCKEHQNDKASLERILMYAVMLYDYFEKRQVLELRAMGEPVVKRVVEGRGLIYDGISMNLRGRELEIRVRVRNYYGPPKPLAVEIERALKSRGEFASLNLRVWID